MKTKMIILIFLLYIIISGCLAVKKVEGLYKFKYHSGYNLIELRKDKSFFYSIHSSQIGIDTFEGTWRISKNKIELSLTKPQIKKYYNPKDSIVELYRKANDSIVIEVLYENSIPEFTPVIGLNNNENDFRKCNLQGIVKLPNNYRLKHFYVDYIGEPGIHYDVKNSKSNYYKVYLYSTGWIQPLTYQAFYHDWIFKNNTLYPIDNENKKVMHDCPHIK
jgi:hypothetical protein